jgi:hypothetical protein
MEIAFDDFHYKCHHKGIHSLLKNIFLKDGMWVPTPFWNLGWLFEIGRIYLIYPQYTISSIKNKIANSVTNNNHQW